MLVIAHRRNTLDQLSSTPASLGVEMDVRLRGDQLIVAHDPLQGGPALDAWLDAYEHALLVINVKEEGLEPLILPRLAARGIERFFLLDQSVPSLVRTVRAGEARCAVRVGDLDGTHLAVQLAGEARWAWCDGFDGFPLEPDVAVALRHAGYRLCLVSPELHGRPPEQIDAWRATVGAMGSPFAAVCTKLPDAWLR